MSVVWVDSGHPSGITVHLQPIYDTQHNNASGCSDAVVIPNLAYSITSPLFNNQLKSPRKKINIFCCSFFTVQNTRYTVTVCFG